MKSDWKKVLTRYISNRYLCDNI